jgi:hypothetical protein
VSRSCTASDRIGSVKGLEDWDAACAGLLVESYACLASKCRWAEELDLFANALELRRENKIGKGEAV